MQCGREASSHLNLSSAKLSKSDLKNASVQQPPFPCNDPHLFVIPSEAEGSAVPRTLLETLKDNGEVGVSMRIQ